MPIRSEDDFRGGSSRLFDDIYDAIVGGVRDYYTDHPAVNHRHRVVTRRNIMRDNIVDRLRVRFDDERGVEVVNKNGTTYFGMNSEFLAVVRKLSRKFAVALNKTQLAMQFQENEGTATLPGEGFDATTNLYFGYVPDVRDPLNPKVYVVCPNGKGYEWFLELTRQAGAMVVNAPTVPPTIDPENLVEIVETPKEQKDRD